MASWARVLFLVLFSFFVLSAVPSALFSAEEKPPAETVDTVEGLAGSFIEYFPRAEGKVVSSVGDKVRLDIGSGDGLKPGMAVFLFRTGKAIRHPVTKAVLGNREDPLGKAILTDIREKESEGNIVEILVTRIIPGDTARLSTDKARMVVAVYGKEYNELVLSRLMNRLRDSGRFDLSGPVSLPEGPALDAASARKLVTDNGGGDLVTLKTSPTAKQDRTRVDMALYSPEGDTISQRDGVVDITSEVYGETVMDYPLVLGEHRDFYHIESLPYRGKHVSAGRITGGDTMEVAVSDGHGITVYRFGEAGMRGLWSDPGSNSDTHMDLECADLDGDGRDEIYVTSMSAGRPSSYVIEYDGAAFKRIADGVPLFFRVLDVPGAGKKLITSAIGSDEPYSGIIREYKWAGGELKKGDALALPRKIKDPYGFVLVDLGRDKGNTRGTGRKSPLDGLDIVMVDDSDYVQVLDMKGEKVWKSKERYGGYDNFFDRAETGTSLASPDDSRGKVKGKIFVMEGEGGTPVVVLTKNLPLTYMFRRFKGYSGAEVHALTWNGSEMEDRWNIINIQGYLSDFQVGDVLNDGRQNILVLTEPTYKAVKSTKKLGIGTVESPLGIFSSKSTLLIYKTPQR